MNAQETPPSPSRLSFTGFDIAGLASAGLALLCAAFVLLIFQPRAAMMFADFGDKPLPAFQHLCMQQWFPLTLGILPLGVACIGLLRQTPLRVRAVLMRLTIFLSLAGSGVLLTGVFMPVHVLGYALE
jgi:hypothetical protein